MDDAVDRLAWKLACDDGRERFARDRGPLWDSYVQTAKRLLDATFPDGYADGHALQELRRLRVAFAKVPAEQQGRIRTDIEAEATGVVREDAAAGGTLRAAVAALTPAQREQLAEAFAVNFDHFGWNRSSLMADCRAIVAKVAGSDVEATS